MTNNQKTLLLIDANSFIHRSFHALPPLEKNGRPTGAIYGLTNTLLKVLRDKKPNYVAAAYDTPEETFRKKMFEEYKAHRPKAPEELVEQIIESYNLFKNLGIETVEKDGFEGDDVLGTLVNKFKKEKDLKILILTGDLDTLQLIENENIVVLTPKRGVSNMKEYDRVAVEKRFGVPPEKIIDYKGLVGDSSDNIPGVPGIGKKTAAKLLQEHGSLENAIKNLKKSGDTTHRTKKLIENEEQAKLSKKLATIKKDISLKTKLEELSYNDNIYKKDLLQYCKDMGFGSLVSRLKKPENIEEIKKENKETLKNSSFFIKSKDLTKKTLKSKKIKVAYNWKSLLKEADKEEVKGPLFDIKIAGWILNPDQKDLSLENLAKIHLEKDANLFQSKKEQKQTLENLFITLHQKIKEKGLNKVFYEIEMPLIEVLVNIENKGIKINKKTLKSLEKKIDKKIENLEKNIYKEAGKEFNINSPQQVGELLFEDLKIKSQGKTSSGQHKTSEAVLVEISKDHKIAELILEYRKFFKIKSTYLNPLLEIANKKSEIKTTFHQIGTSTGRLSSEKPNMQNIPKGSEWATEIRKSFEARKGYSFLAFDYSQLELRLFAHISGDKNLKKAFEQNQDIHSLTASKVLDKSIKKITDEERDLAKSLNFGVVFGMGSRAFSKQSGLSIKKSKEFIDKYFKDFPDVKKWQDNIKKEANKNGFVKNENGRIRYIQSGGAMDRAAINMPLQSLGADIIKTAMIKVFNTLKEDKNLKEKAFILLSIHDELLLEVHNDILKKVTPIVKEIMENDCDNVSVPLTIEVKKGKNWGDMKSIKI